MILLYIILYLYIIITITITIFITIIIIVIYCIHYIMYEISYVYIYIHTHIIMYRHVSSFVGSQGFCDYLRGPRFPRSKASKAPRCVRRVPGLHQALWWKSYESHEVRKLFE